MYRLNFDVHPNFSTEILLVLQEHVVPASFNNRLRLLLGPFPLGKTAPSCSASANASRRWRRPLSLVLRRFVIQCFQHRKWCLLLLGLHLYRCCTLDEEVCHVEVALLDREKESRLPCVVTVIDFKSLAEVGSVRLPCCPGLQPRRGASAHIHLLPLGSRPCQRIAWPVSEPRRRRAAMKNRKFCRRAVCRQVMSASDKTFLASA